MLHAEVRGLSLRPCRNPATRTFTCGLGKYNKTFSLNTKKAPGGVNPLLQGHGGYTRRVRSRAPTEASSTKHHPTRSCHEPSLVKTSGRALALSPEARGLLSGTIKRGSLSKNQKHRLDLIKIEAKRQPPANPYLIRGSTGLAGPPQTISGLTRSELGPK